MQSAKRRAQDSKAGLLGPKSHSHFLPFHSSKTPPGGHPQTPSSWDTAAGGGGQREEGRGLGSCGGSWETRCSKFLLFALGQNPESDQAAPGDRPWEAEDGH